MSRSTIRLALAALALAAPSGALALPTLANPDEPRLLVTFTDRPGADLARERLAGLGTVNPLVPEAGTWTLTPRRVDGVRARAAARPMVRAAEWSLGRRIHELTDPLRQPEPPAPLVSSDLPLDPLATEDNQWGLFAPATSWTPTLTGSASPVRIAILDGGIDEDHDEWRGPSSPLVHPRSTFADNFNADDWGFTGHGTHVAGIAAAPWNGVGIVGVAPQPGVIEVIPVQIADRQGRSTDETMMKGIRWAVNHGARVINISAGGPGYSQAFQNTINWAYRRALIVSSVGNEGDSGSEINYPAAYDHVLGVGAQCDGRVDPPDCPEPYGPALFTNHNRSLDVIAPGVNMLSSVPRRVNERELEDGYAWKDGTSMASPFAAGVAALVFAANPGATPDQVLRHIQATAKDVDKPGRDAKSGAGLVDPARALSETLPPADNSEANDDVRDLSGVASLKEAGPPATIAGLGDRYDDPSDLYPLQLRKGQRVTVNVNPGRAIVSLRIYRPGTPTVRTRSKSYEKFRLLAERAEVRGGPKQIANVVAPSAGRHFVQVAYERGSGPYTLTIDRGQ